MTGRTWSGCGHPKTENNTVDWVEKSGGRPRYRKECRTCRRRAGRVGHARRTKLVDPAVRRAKRAATRARLLAEGLPDPADPRHGTLNGYNTYGCRCDRCCEAIATHHRVTRLMARARKLGIPIPRELTRVKSVVSLDAVAEARFGMDRVLVGSTWDDPTGDAAVAAVGDDPYEWEDWK